MIAVRLAAYTALAMFAFSANSLLCRPACKYNFLLAVVLAIALLLLALPWLKLGASGWEYSVLSGAPASGLWVMYCGIGLVLRSGRA
jgi:hypothetical protein